MTEKISNPNWKDQIVSYDKQLEPKLVMMKVPIALQLLELVLLEGSYHPQEFQIVHPENQRKVLDI